MKKICLVFLALILLCASFGCTKDTKPQAEGATSATAVAVSVDATAAAATLVPTPTPSATPAPTPTPEPTPTPTPTPSPIPSPTPVPYLVFADDFALIAPERTAKLTIRCDTYKELPDKQAVEVRLADGTVVGSAVLKRARDNKVEVTLPTGLSPRTTLYLFAEGISYPIHTVDVAVLDKEYVPVLGNYERDDKMIALTFDCAYGEVNTDYLLDTLQAYGIHATFFMTGGWAGNHERWIERMIADGHEIGNHTMSHPSMTGLSNNEILSQIARTSEVIYEKYGYTVHLFRPPYGASNAKVNTIARYCGCEVIKWGQTSKDASDGWTGERIIKLLLEELQPGDIVLCHNGAPELHNYLEPVLTELVARGYTFGTVSELMGWTWDDADTNTP